MSVPNPEKLVTAKEAVEAGGQYRKVEGSFNPNEEADENGNVSVSYTYTPDTPKKNIVVDVLFEKTD